MGHTYSNILLHTIFSTKDRRRMIDDSMRVRLNEYLGGIARAEFGATKIVGGTDDHIHGLISLRTDVSVASAMAKWKSLSSGWIHKAFPDQRDFAWQPGYGVFSVSQSQAAGVVEYIAGQEDHHRELTFEQEFLAFLRRHEIDYDPRMVFE